MAEEKYFRPLKISVSQALKFYPNAYYYIYDCGLSDESKVELEEISTKVRIIPWTVRYIPINRIFPKNFQIKKAFGILRNCLLNKVKNPSLQSFLNEQEFEIKILNKLAIIKYHNDTVNQKFIFLDADAFLVGSIDELLNDDFDIGLTVRRKDEISYETNSCRLLNTGVILFLGKHESNRAIIDEWSLESSKTTEAIIEQTSLSRLIEKKLPSFFDYPLGKHITEIGGERIKIAALSCETYNFNWIEEYSIERNKNVKILHFKSERFKTPLFEEIAKKLNINT